jgi:HlyD family secretion protein
VILALGAIAIVLVGRGRQSSPSDQLRVSGMVEATTTDLGPEINGKIAAIRVREGDVVKQGQVVADLDPSTWQARLDQAQGQADQAGRKASEADTQVGAQSATVAAKEGQTEASRREAGETFTKLRNGSRPQEVEGAYEQVRSGYAAWKAAEETVTKLKHFVRPEEFEEAKAALKVADAQVAMSQAKLDRLKAGSRPQEIDQAKSAASLAKANADQARRDWQRSDQLAKAKVISAQEAEVARTKYETLHDQQASAEQALSLVIEGPHRDDIANAAAEVRKDQAQREQLYHALKLLNEGARVEDIRAAEQDATRLRKAYEALRQQYLLVRAGPRNEDVRAASDEVQRASAAVAEARAGEKQVDALRREAEAARAQQKTALAAAAEAKLNLGRTHLYSPCDGVIQTKVAEVGEAVLPGGPVLRIVDLGDVWITVYVAETQIGRVKVGQKAAVTTDSQPGKRYEGVVEMVSSEAEFTPKYVQTPDERSRLVYAVRVRIDNRERIFKPGMPADAVLDLSPSAGLGTYGVTR